VPDLTDLRLSWDSFWSKYHANHQQSTQLYQAKFAELYRVAPLLRKQPQTPSLMLGIGPYRRPLRVYPTATKPQLGNVLDIGPSQCGKSTRAIGEVLDFAGSVVVNDIKGEIRAKTAGFRRLLGKIYTSVLAAGEIGLIR
jgi:type IV secretory pathway TraG/TraD family ATPase VirD4